MAETIQLLGGEAGAPVVVEYLADTGSTIYPGDHLERDNATEVSEFSTAGGNSAKLFALENVSNGGTIDTVYTAGETVRCGYFKPGQTVYARVAAGAAAIAVGDALQAANDGTLAKHTPRSVNEAGSNTWTEYLNAIVGYAEEAVDNSGGGSVVRIKVRIS